MRLPTRRALAALSALALHACASRSQPAVDEHTAVTNRARDVVAALRAHDMARVASFVHPVSGVRFSPYPHVLASDRAFARDAVARLWTDTTAYDWGAADGSGEPLVMPFGAYYARFVYDHDYATAPQTAYTAAPIQPGNSPSNLAEMYPGARWVEYHFAGFDAKYDGMDWASLWLVFQAANGDWFLVAVVHGAWTI